MRSPLLVHQHFWGEALCLAPKQGAGGGGWYQKPVHVCPSSWTQTGVVLRAGLFFLLLPLAALWLALEGSTCPIFSVRAIWVGCLTTFPSPSTGPQFQREGPWSSWNQQTASSSQAPEAGAGRIPCPVWAAESSVRDPCLSFWGGGTAFWWWWRRIGKCDPGVADGHLLAPRPATL